MSTENKEIIFVSFNNTSQANCHRSSVTTSHPSIINFMLLFFIQYNIQKQLDATYTHPSYLYPFHFQISNDGQEFEVTKPVAKIFKAIVDDSIDDLDEDSPQEDYQFRIPRLSGKTLGKVVTYCEYYEQNGMNDITLPIKTKDVKEVLARADEGGSSSDDEHAQWYSDFANVDTNTSLELLTAANFLNIPPLMDLAAFMIYVNFDGKSFNDMKNMFHLSSAPVGESNILGNNQNGNKNSHGTVMKDNGKIRDESNKVQDTEPMNVRHNGQQGNGAIREGQHANNVTYAQILMKNEKNK